MRHARLARALVLVLLVGCDASTSTSRDAGADAMRAPTRLVRLHVVGEGRVRSEPPGLDCTSACTAEFAEDVTVTLTATAGAGRRFQGFGGACAGTSCTLHGAVEQSVDARFVSDPAEFWLQPLAASRPYEGESVAVDATGHVVVGGTFSGTLESGGGPVVQSMQGFFVARYTPDGAHLWTVHAAQTVLQLGHHVATGPDGQVVVAGELYGTADFGDGIEHSATGLSNAFVASYAPQDGALRWVRLFAGTGSSDAVAVALDGQGDVVVTGSFSGDFDAGDGAVSGGVGGTIFVAKLAGESGLLRWKQVRHPDVYGGWPSGVAIDGSDDVIVADFRASGGPSRQVAEHWLARLSGVDGAPLWEHTLGASTAVLATAAGRDEAVYVAGRFSGQVTLAGGPPMTAAGGDDAFVARFDRDGTLVWARAMGGELDELGYGLALLPSGQLVTVGWFRGLARFGDDAFSDALSRGGSDLFVATYSADGDFVALASAGGALDDVALGVGAGGTTSAVVGLVSGPVDVLGTPLVPSGDSDQILFATDVLPMDGAL